MCPRSRGVVTVITYVIRILDEDFDQIKNLIERTFWFNSIQDFVKKKTIDYLKSKFWSYEYVDDIKMARRLTKTVALYTQLTIS